MDPKQQKIVTMMPQQPGKALLRTTIKCPNIKRKYMTQRHVSQGDLHINMHNLWKAKSKEELKLITAIRKSEVFSPERVQTFVKFNFRIVENKNVNYESTFRKVLEPKKNKDLAICRGTMHVSDLWCESNMQEIVGNLPYPKDRLKILKQYQKRNQAKMQAVGV